MDMIQYVMGKKLKNKIPLIMVPNLLRNESYMIGKSFFVQYNNKEIPLHCIVEYYQSKRNDSRKITNCRLIQERYGLEYSGYNCSTCHLEAANLALNNKLLLKK